MGRNILKNFLVCSIAVFIGLGIQVVLAQTNSYFDPVCGPSSASWPNCNVNPPINEGPWTQTKAGSIVADGLGSTNLTVSRFTSLVTTGAGRVTIGHDNGYTSYPTGTLSITGNTMILAPGAAGIRMTYNTISAYNLNTTGDRTMISGDGDLYLQGGRFGTSGKDGNLFIKTGSQVGGVIIGQGGLVNLDIQGNINVNTRITNLSTYVKGLDLKVTTTTLNPNVDANSQLSAWPASWRNFRMDTGSINCDSDILTKDCFSASYSAGSVTDARRYDLFVEITSNLGASCPPPGPAAKDPSCVYRAAATSFNRLNASDMLEGGEISARNINISGVLQSKSGAFLGDLTSQYYGSSPSSPGTGNYALSIGTRSPFNGGLVVQNAGGGALFMSVGGAGGYYYDDTGLGNTGDVVNDTTAIIDVRGGSAIDQGRLMILPGRSGGTGASSPALGNVGIGIDPVYASNFKLAVAGAIRGNSLYGSAVCLRVGGSGSPSNNPSDYDCKTSWSQVVNTSTMITGSASGTTNYIPKWTGARSLGNSMIYDDGSIVTIRTTNTSAVTDQGASLLVKGKIIFENDMALPASAPRSGIRFADDTFQATAAINAWEEIGTSTYRLNGNVGIGTNSPGKTLDVNGTVRFSSGHLISSAINGAFVLNAGPETTGAGGFHFRRNTTRGEEAGFVDLLRITGNGRVGIGTTNPGATLDLNGENVRFRLSNFGNTFIIEGPGSSPKFQFASDPADLTIGGGSQDGDISILSSNNSGIPTITLSGDGGVINATVKNFRIPNPINSNQYLVHSAIEGPEYAVFYRGTARLVNGQAIVNLPNYFEALTRAEGRTVLLTPQGGWSPLFVDGKVVNGKFTVKTTEDGNQSQEFHWEVKAVRYDVSPLQAEVEKE
ncbi:MAG: hypothetical protein KGZ30_03640 [Anaplasmataceae bacterium]|nr:hypothetical protein [Anaplasmataceae bacterium]